MCWGSSGRPGHMAALGGICIKFISPSKLFPARGHQNAVKSPARSQCLLFLLFPPASTTHLPSHTQTHTTLRSLSTLNLRLHKQSEKEGWGWVLGLSELQCVCVFKHVHCCLYCCVYACVCAALFSSHQERSNL